MSKINRQQRVLRGLAGPWLCTLFSGVLLAVLSSATRAEPTAAEQNAPDAAQTKAAVAEPSPTAPAQAKPKSAEGGHVRPADKPYYIEFRARNAESYGHTFSIYGRVNANGKVGAFTVAGLHPISESAVPWMIGHIMAVPSETGASDGDTDDQYVLARFHVALSAEEFKKVVAYVKEHQKNSPMWHAVLYNCNAWVGDVAKFMGMDVPASPLLMPADYINGLKKLNMNKAGIIGTPVEVASPAQLRAARLRAIAAQGKKIAGVADGAAQKTDHASAKTPGDKPQGAKTQGPKLQKVSATSATAKFEPLDPTAVH
jgi:hypothetical protein